MDSNQESLAPEPYAKIPAQSRRQAMDWSLVLASQDIHPIIAPPGESPAWTLLVDPVHYQRALAAIHQYRLENRGWGWRRELPGGTLEIHAGALFWCLLLGFAHWVVSFVQPGFYPAGRMDNVRVVAGEWWRLFTAVLLHSDLAHLMANITFGVIMLGFAMARFGPGVALLATFLAGAAGNVCGLVLYDHPYLGVGASGMMMGALGLLCIHSFGLWRQSPKAARYILSGVCAGVLIFVLFGFSPNADILAHLGGFVAGLVFGILLAFVPQSTLEKPALNVLALSLLLVLLLLTWGLALKPPRWAA